MKKLLLPSLGLIASLIISQHTLALTFRTGEVIGPDGKSYVGMSPQNKANMLANTATGEIKSGVMNKHFYLVYNNQVVTVPVTELRNKTTPERMAIIKQAITTQGGAQLSNTTLNINSGQSPTPLTDNDIDSNRLTSGIDNATQGLKQEVEHSLDREIQDVSDQLEKGQVREVEHSIEQDLEHSLGQDLEHSLEHDIAHDLENNLEQTLGHDIERDLDSVFDDNVENEINDHLENDLEDELNDVLDHDFENEINHHLENDLEDELNDALGHDFENEINHHLEQDDVFDRIDHDDRNESHDDDDDDSHNDHDD